MFQTGVVKGARPREPRTCFHCTQTIIIKKGYIVYLVFQGWHEVVLLLYWIIFWAALKALVLIFLCPEEEQFELGWTPVNYSFVFRDLWCRGYRVWFARLLWALCKLHRDRRAEAEKAPVLIPVLDLCFKFLMILFDSRWNNKLRVVWNSCCVDPGWWLWWWWRFFTLLSTTILTISSQKTINVWGLMKIYVDKLVHNLFVVEMKLLSKRCTVVNMPLYLSSFNIR